MSDPLCSVCGTPFARLSPRQLTCGPACGKVRREATTAIRLARTARPTLCGCGRLLLQHPRAGRPRKTCNVCRAVARGLLTHEDVKGISNCGNVVKRNARGMRYPRVIQRCQSCANKEMWKTRRAISG